MGFQTIFIYTDGSCVPLKINGPQGTIKADAGGWCAHIIMGPESSFIYGGQESTSNNTMELRAVIEGLRHTKGHKKLIRLYTDSNYVRGRVNWIRRNIKEHLAQGHPRSKLYKKMRGGAIAANVEECVELAKVLRTVRVEVRWIPGHTGIRHHDRADKIARREALRVRNQVKARWGLGV